MEVEAELASEVACASDSLLARLAEIESKYSEAESDSEFRKLSDSYVLCDALSESVLSLSTTFFCSSLVATRKEGSIPFVVFSCA